MLGVMMSNAAGSTEEKAQFICSYRQLPAMCYSDCAPTPVSAPQWLAFNTALAAALPWPSEYGFTEAGLALFAGNKLPSWCQPLAMAYTGHQFGHLAPRLGDGRALLLTELLCDDGQRVDVQLKGAGPTPYSRRGDGRAALGPVLREYLVSETMAALGVPTTRALAAVLTGDWVYRQQALPGAVLCRVAQSHVRVGTVQFWARHLTQHELQQALDYVIARHYPAAAHAAEPYVALLSSVCQAQAQLIAHWMSIGFVHGVMNTDNMTLSGETIDYGPCAFLDHYHAEQWFSSIDEQGRYAYQQQPVIAQWNLARLAEAMLPCLGADEASAIARATAVLNDFVPQYQHAWRTRFAAKLGFSAAETTEQAQADQQLIAQLLQLMQEQEVDFTAQFRRLPQVLSVANTSDPSSVVVDSAAAPRWLALWRDPAAVQTWLTAWQQRLQQHLQLTGGTVLDIQTAMLAVNPARIPRNHALEAVLTTAIEQGDLRPFHHALALLQQPFVESDDGQLWQDPPATKQPYRTFCGT
jgi:uncharacterized protein YdiU (UPF0061 family)